MKIVIKKENSGIPGREYASLLDTGDTVFVLEYLNDLREARLSTINWRKRLAKSNNLTLEVNLVE